MIWEIEEHFSKTHSVHCLLLGLSEFWKSAPQLQFFKGCIPTQWQWKFQLLLDFQRAAPSMQYICIPSFTGQIIFTSSHIKMSDQNVARVQCFILQCLPCSRHCILVILWYRKNRFPQIAIGTRTQGGPNRSHDSWQIPGIILPHTNTPLRNFKAQPQTASRTQLCLHKLFERHQSTRLHRLISNKSYKKPQDSTLRPVPRTITSYTSSMTVFSKTLKTKNVKEFLHQSRLQIRLRRRIKETDTWQIILRLHLMTSPEPKAPSSRWFCSAYW